MRKMLKQKGRGVENPAYLPIWERHRLGGQYRGRFQCDASDRRKVTLPDNSTIETTNLVFGEFDILAAGLFAFRERWDFAFALNRDLPASTNKNYTDYQRQRLITSMIPITWPVQKPFVTDLYGLLDLLVAEEEARRTGRSRTATPTVVELPPAKETRVVEEPQLKVVEKRRRKKS